MWVRPVPSIKNHMGKSFATKKRSLNGPGAKYGAARGLADVDSSASFGWRRWRFEIA